VCVCVCVYLTRVQKHQYRRKIFNSESRTRRIPIIYIILVYGFLKGSNTRKRLGSQYVCCLFHSLFYLRILCIHIRTPGIHKYIYIYIYNIFTSLKMLLYTYTYTYTTPHGYTTYICIYIVCILFMCF